MKKTLFSTVVLFFCTLSGTGYAKDFKFVQKFQGIIGYNNSLSPMTVSYDKLPTGTQLTITNFSNGKQAHVTVAGNGAVQKGRLLDVSSDVADQLGFTKDGIAYANIVVDKMSAFNPMDKIAQENQQAESNAEDETPPPVAEPPHVIKNQGVEKDTRKVNKVVGEPEHIDNKAQDLNVNRIFVIQFAAFSTLDRAQQFQAKLARNDIKTYVAKEGANGRDLYKVREATIYRDLQAVFSQVLIYQKQGYPDCFAVGKFFLAKNNQDGDNTKAPTTYVQNTNTGIQTNSGPASVPQTDTDNSDDDDDN